MANRDRRAIEALPRMVTDTWDGDSSLGNDLISFVRQVPPRRRLSEYLAEARGEPIEFRGRIVHGMYEFPPISSPTVLEVTFEQCESRTHPQGLELVATDGVLSANQTPSAGLRLWTDTAPPTFEVRVDPDPGRATALRVWNIWRDYRDTVHAWIGDAGMLVEEPTQESPALTLRCSDGFDAPTFDDLVVRIVATAAA